MPSATEPGTGAALPLRVAFAGTPEFAAQALQALHNAGFELCLALSQPDRPAGRGLQLTASPVKRLALQLGLPLAQPRSLRLDGRYPEDAAQARQALLAARPDVLIVAAYGLILPQWVLDLPPWGCLNIHGSLLPRWRGAAPIQRAIEAGDLETGITIMQMDAGLDTGAMLLRETVPIEPTDTSASLQVRLAALGAKLITEALQRLQATGPSALPAEPQPEMGVNYAHKIDKSEAALNWADAATALERRIRAFDPFPGTTLAYAGETLKAWRAAVITCPPDQAHCAPGTALDLGPQRLAIACGEPGSALELLELQRPGGRRLATAQVMEQIRQHQKLPAQQTQTPQAQQAQQAQTQTPPPKTQASGACKP